MPRTLRTVVLVALVTAVLAPARGDQGDLIDSLDGPCFSPPKEKGRADLVEGKVGKAMRFRFEKDARSTFFASNLRGTTAWDRAAGFSFWVKNEGGDDYGGLQFIYDDDYAVRYDLAFPVTGKDWTKVTVAWGDLIPVLPGPRAKPLGGRDGNRPSKLSALWIGKWWYWGDYPPLDFAVDEIRLEPTVARDESDHRPAGPPLARVAARLRVGKPVTVVTMGDSLTDTRHWANRRVSWPKLLADGLKEAYGSDVTVVNPAIGGTQLRQNLVLLPRWLGRVPEPDLVTIFFGGNDWESGMRGAEFEGACAEAVDRVRRATHGKSDVLLITTNPTAAHWGVTTELAEACRAAARERNAGLADTEAAFRVAGATGRDRLYVDDKVHLSPAGHSVVAETVVGAIGFAGR